MRLRIQTAKPESAFEKSLEQELQRFCLELSGFLDKGLKFSDNFDAQIIEVADTGLASTEFSVAHTLKRVPTGFLIINKDKTGNGYDSGTAWTDTAIYLKYSTANTALTLLVF